MRNDAHDLIQDTTGIFLHKLRWLQPPMFFPIHRILLLIIIIKINIFSASHKKLNHILILLRLTMKILFFSMLSDIWNSTGLCEGPHALPPCVSSILKWRWLWSIGRKMRGEKWSTWGRNLSPVSLYPPQISHGTLVIT